MCIQGIQSDFKCIHTYQIMIIMYKLTNMSIFLCCTSNPQNSLHYVTKTLLKTAEGEEVKPGSVTTAEYAAERQSVSDCPALGPRKQVIPFPCN